jgi:sphingomyelin phosphodiesterase
MLDPIDPANQLKWLVHQLQEAETANEKVHIIGHIPPDSRECTQAWLYNYLRIMERYEDTILAQYYGHTHRDEFRILYSLYKQPKPVSIAFIGPSMTPYTENNPAYRVYSMDSNGYLNDYTTFYFNLSEANSQMTPPKWKLGYQAKSTFKLFDLGPDSWHNFITRLEQDENLFQSYHR